MNISIRELKQNERIPEHLLFAADPSAEMQNDYLKNGKCFVVEMNKRIIGEYILLRLNSNQAEVKNISVDEEFQNLGIGKQLLQHAIAEAKGLECNQLQIATGNSSIQQLNLYQKMGFEMVRLVKNYFVDNYPNPIFENGIQCKHLIILQKNLTDSDQSMM